MCVPGIKKDVDNLGRICIPKEMRDMFNLNGTVELVMTESGILVRNPKYVLCEIANEEAESLSENV